MVSFSCEGCNETMVKKKVGPHINWCGSAVTCIDCGHTFDNQTFKQHNQCITEDQKYQGKLYRPKPVKGAAPPTEEKPAPPAAVEEAKPSKKSKKSVKNSSKSTPVRVTKTRSLKKVLKDLRKEHKIDEKDLLKKIVLTPEGQLVLS